jgi:glycosyltransferase involved in cell wall biosynthesis
MFNVAPTILIGAEHGIGRILEENGCGFTVTPGDGEALTERIFALAGDRELCVSLGARARMAFERQWDKEKALTEWHALLQAVGHPIVSKAPTD